MTEFEIACDLAQAELIVQAFDDITKVVCEGELEDWMTKFDVYKLEWNEDKSKLIGLIQVDPMKAP